MAYRIILIALFAFLIATPSKGNAPDKDIQTITLNGLRSPVEIYRDSYGTPYIVAKNSHDLFFAHGYLQAMDRLFQIDGIRRIPQGKTSEIIGSDMIDMDISFCQIGLDRVAKKSLDLMSPESKDMFEAFSDGVNAYIANCGNNLPLEFNILGYKPEKWSSYDSLCAMRLVGWWLSYGMNQELFYDSLVTDYGKDIASKLFSGIPSRDEIDLAVSQRQKCETTTEKIDKPKIPKDSNFVRKVKDRGTNLWVVSGKKTESGYPILANDPHLELFSPAIWYEVGLSCPEFTVVGVVFPGLPIPLIGTNGKVAWGAASFPADTQDVYLEKIDPKSEKHYEYDGKTLSYKVHSYQIKPKGEEPLNVEVLEGIHGPVIFSSVDTNYSLRWTGAMPSDDIACFLKAAKSQDIFEFRDAFSTFKMMPQHFMAIDKMGNILHVQPGSYPVRDGFNGDLPLIGWNAQYEWKGFIPFNEIPILINPTDGFINNSNNCPDCFTGIDIGTTFPHPSRSIRTREILSSRKNFTVKDMQSMQLDVLNPMAREILPLMLQQIDGLNTSQCQNEIDMLKNWDYQEKSDSIAATIYNKWWTELPKHIFKKMGLNLLTYRDYVDQCSLAMIDILRNGKSSGLWSWLELGDESDFKQTCLVALQIAVQTLEKDYGTDRSNWQWGQVHKSHFAHPSKVPFLLDGGSYGVGGSRYSLLVSHYNPSSGFESTFGPSYRFIATLSNGGKKIIAKSVLPPGNLAAPLSPHFKDQMQMWVKGDLKDLKVYPDEIKTLPITLKLSP